jgi:hypothetical protein
MLAVTGHASRHALGRNAVSEYRFAGGYLWRSVGFAGNRIVGRIVVGDGIGHDRQSQRSTGSRGNSVKPFIEPRRRNAEIGEFTEAARSDLRALLSEISTRLGSARA